MGVATGCGFKEIYRFPHTTYPYSSCICTFWQQHPYFCFHFVNTCIYIHPHGIYYIYPTVYIYIPWYIYISPRYIYISPRYIYSTPLTITMLQPSFDTSLVPSIDLLASVSTTEWSTQLIPLGVGVYQGDPLSVTIFNTVINTLVDTLGTRLDLGFHISGSRHKLCPHYKPDSMRIHGSGLNPLPIHFNPVCTIVLQCKFDST